MRHDRCQPSLDGTYLSIGTTFVGSLGTAIIAVYIVGASRWVATDDGWYRSLTKPAWQPPDAIFGLIWPYNFIMLVAATWVVASSATRTAQTVWLGCLALSVAAALTWAWLFYVPHSLVASGFALVAATVLTLPLVIIAFRSSIPLGVAMLPYQLWLAIATSLAFGYAAQ